MIWMLAILVAWFALAGHVAFWLTAWNHVQATSWPIPVVKATSKVLVFCCAIVPVIIGVIFMTVDSEPGVHLIAEFLFRDGLFDRSSRNPIHLLAPKATKGESQGAGTEFVDHQVRAIPVAEPEVGVETVKMDAVDPWKPGV